MSIIIITTEMDWLPRLLQTNDSLFPSGSFAHSFGLEGLVQLEQITDPESLGDFMRDQLVPALENFELPVVRLAHGAALRGDVARLLALDERYGAMKGSFELRRASHKIGSQRLEMLQKLRPHSLLLRLEKEKSAGQFGAHATIIYGVQTALSQTPLSAALLGFYYQNLAGVVSAALKLIRIGQLASQSLLTDFLDQAAAVTKRSEKIDETEIGWFQAILDIASMRHETAYCRIFIS